MKDALLVLSGGLDSTTMLYEYQHRIALAISFHYGSNHNERELSFAQLHCERLGIPHKIIRLPFFKELFHSSLLEGAEAIPEGDYKEENMRSTVVPFRNGIMLSIAAGVAENEKLPYIMLANHGGDHTIYPDCRADFVEAMNNAVHFGTWNGVKQETWRVRSLGQEDPLEKDMATHCSILAREISWTEEPSGLQSMGSQRVGHS